MSQSIQTGQTTVTGEVSVVADSTAVPQKAAYLYKTNTGATTVLTVPADTVCRIKYICIQGLSTAGLTSVSAGGATILGMAHEGANLSTMNQLSFGTGYLELSAAQTVAITCSVSPAVYITVLYEEVSLV